MNVAVVGWGKFGQAIGSLLEYNNVEFETADVGRLLTRQVDVAFLMVPTQFMRSALQDNAAFFTPDTIMVNGAKGIEEKTHELPHQIVAGSGDFARYYSLMGPSFAHGIKTKQPTLVSLGWEDETHIGTITELLQTPYFRIQPTAGRNALELAGAMKNLYAILCGYSQGLGHTINTRAMLITLALQEFQTLMAARGYDGLEPSAPGAVGDLVLTCSSEQSRNFQFGQALAKVKDAAELTEQHTVEGYHTSHSIKAIAEACGAELPLAFLTQQLIENPSDGARQFDAFVAGI